MSRRNCSRCSYEHLILFQEISERDVEVAARFGLRHDGNRENTGVVGGVRALVQRLDCDFLLLLGNDCPAVVPLEEIRRQIDGALHDMESENIPVFRFRSQRQPGEGSPP